jgi:hypothetical protein
MHIVLNAGIFLAKAFVLKFLFNWFISGEIIDTELTFMESVGIMLFISFIKMTFGDLADSYLNMEKAKEKANELLALKIVYTIFLFASLGIGYLINLI